MSIRISQIFWTLDVYRYTHTELGEIAKAVRCGQVLFLDLSPSHSLCSAAAGPFSPEKSLSHKPFTSYLLGLMYKRERGKEYRNGELERMKMSGGEETIWRQLEPISLTLTTISNNFVDAKKLSIFN